MLSSTSLFAGVIAFIDVRSGAGNTENRGPAVGQQLEALGATVRDRGVVGEGG